MSSIIKPQVPEGLRDLMKDLTREILKEKPVDIYDFAEQFFRSRLPQKETYAVRRFEESYGKYDFSHVKNSQHYQVPVVLVYSIIPDGLTNLIKELIKAVLREHPQNLSDFAVKYFRHIKAATSTDSETKPKEINYSAYENYFMNKERFLFTPYVKCTCGRTLVEAYQNEHLSSIHKIQNYDLEFHSKTIAADDTNNNAVNKMPQNDSIYYEKYINAISIIQRYIRRYLKIKNVTTKTKEISSNHHSLCQGSMTTKSEACRQYEHTAQVMQLVPQLQLNQNETVNNSVDISYTSASTALLSATESGRETSKPSTSDSILTKTIIEGEGKENDEKHISDSFKQTTNEHVQVEATTNNKETEDYRIVNVPAETVDSQRIAKDANELAECTAVFKNKGLESKEIDTRSGRSQSNETDENLAAEDLESISNVETKKFRESKEHGNIHSVIARTNVNTFGNDHAANPNNKEHISKSVVGELHKKSEDINETKIDKLNKCSSKEKLSSECILNAETEVINKENSFNLPKEANEVAIHSTNNIENLVIKSFELIDNEKCTSGNETLKKSQEIEQTNSADDYGDNISEIVDKNPIKNFSDITEGEIHKHEQNPILRIQEDSIADSIENEAEHDKQKDSIEENTKPDLLEEIAQKEMNSNNTGSINKSANNLKPNSLETNVESNADDENIHNTTENQEIYDKAEFLEKVSQTKEQENEKFNASNYTHNKSAIETSKANFDTVEATGNDKQDSQQQDASKIEWHEENAKSTNTDNVPELDNKSISSKIQKEPIRHERDSNKIIVYEKNTSAELYTNDTEGALFSSNPNDDADIPLSENTNEKLGTNLKDSSSHLKDDADITLSETTNEKLGSNIKYSTEYKLAKIFKSTESLLDKNTDLKLDKEPKIINTNDNGEKDNKSPESIKIFFEVESEKENFYETQIEKNIYKTEDSKDNHVDSIKQDVVELTAKDDLNENPKENSQIETTDTDETDKNKVQTSKVDTDKNKSYTNSLLKNQIDLTLYKNSCHLVNISQETEKDANPKNYFTVNETVTGYLEKNIDEPFKNELIDGTNTNNSKNTNVDSKFENQVQEVNICKTDKDEIGLNQEEKSQDDLNMKENNPNNAIDKDFNPKSESEKPLIGSITTKTTKDETDYKLEEVYKTKLCKINTTSIEEKKSNETIYVAKEKTKNDKQDTIPKDLYKIKDNTPAHEYKYDEVDCKTLGSVIDPLDEQTQNSFELKDKNQSIKSQSESDIVKYFPLKANKNHQTVDIQAEAPKPELDQNNLNDNNEVLITENSSEPITNDKVANNIQQSFQSNLDEKYKSSDIVDLNTKQQSDSNLPIDIAVNETANKTHESASQKNLEKNATLINENENLSSEELSQKQPFDSITSETAIIHTNEKKFQIKDESIENYKSLKTENIPIAPSVLPEDNKKVKNSNNTHELSSKNELQKNTFEEDLAENKTNSKQNVTSESQNENVKTEPQLESNDEFKQNKNLPKNLQTEQIETNNNIYDSTSKHFKNNSEKNNIKTGEKHEPLKKTNDEIIISDSSALFKAMYSTTLESKEVKTRCDTVIDRHNSMKPKFDSEISQIEVDNSVKKIYNTDQDVKKPENSININKSNSLEEPVQIMLDESKNIIGESCEKTVNEIDTSANITHQDTILSKISKTGLDTDAYCINLNNNISVVTEKREQIPQDSSINELNSSNIVPDAAIDRTFTLKSAESTDKEKVERNLMEILQTKLEKNKNIEIYDSTTNTNLENVSGSDNIALKDFTKSDLDEVKELIIDKSEVKPYDNNVRDSSNEHIKAEILDETTNDTEVHSQYINSNKKFTKSSIKQPDQISVKLKNSLSFSEYENRVKIGTVIETTATSTRKHDDDSKIEKKLSLSLNLNDNVQSQSEESTNVLPDTRLSDSIECETKVKLESTDEKDTKDKKYIPLSIENEPKRSKQLEASKEEVPFNNVDFIDNTLNKASIESQAKKNTAANESSVDIKNLNTVDANDQLTASSEKKIDLNSNSFNTAIENMSNCKDKNEDSINDDGENKMFVDGFKDRLASSTDNHVINQLSLTKLDTTCMDDTKTQSEISEKEIYELKSKNHEDKRSTVANSNSMQVKNVTINTKNSAEISTNNQMLESEIEVGVELKKPSAEETVEQTQEPKQIKELQNDDDSSSMIFNDLEITNKNIKYDRKHIIDLKKVNEEIQTIPKLEESYKNRNEATSITIDTNIARIVTKQMKKYAEPNEVEKPDYNQIELKLNSKNSTQNEPNLNVTLDPQHDRDNDKQEGSGKSVTYLKDLTTGSKNSVEFHKDSNCKNEDVQNSKIGNKNGTNLENKLISQISLKSKETETDYNVSSKLEDKNKSNDEIKPNKELVDNQNIGTIQDGLFNQQSKEEQMLKVNANVNLNEKKKIQQLVSGKNISNLSDSQTITNVFNKETALENNTLSIMLTLEPELPNIKINLEVGATNANENIEILPLEIEENKEISSNDIKNTSSNPLIHNQLNVSLTKNNEQEITDSCTTKHLEEINSLNTDTNKLNAAIADSLHGDPSYYKTKTETTNNDELQSSDEIVHVDSNLNIQDSAQIIKSNNESSSDNITNNENLILSDEQTSLCNDESKDLNIVKNHSSLTSNELEDSVRGPELQYQQVVEKANTNNDDSANHLKSERRMCKDDQNNEISDGDRQSRSSDTSKEKETELITKNKILDTSSELTLPNNAANFEITIFNEASHDHFNHETTGQTNADVKGANTNEQETTHNIGIQTPETFIGNQNLNIGKVRNIHNDLVGSISGQRFAETHLKSFWKEYVMNNSIPLSQYDYRENETKEEAMSGSVHEVNKTRFANNKNEEQIIHIVEPEVIKETIMQIESSPIKNQNIFLAYNDSNPPKHIERIPRYFFGLPDRALNDKSSHLNQKSYKEPTAFTIPMGVSNKVLISKIAAAIEEPNSELVLLKGDKKLSLSNLNLAECTDAEPLLDAETPTKFFQDLHEFEYEIHDVGMNITFTINKIIRLRIENDCQHNSDNDEHSNEISEYSVTSEPMLQTIIELSESETPKPPDQLHSIDDDFLANLEKISDSPSTSWTTGPKEDNSFISDEFLDEKYKYAKATPTKSNSGRETQGGIYEFAKDEIVSKEIQSQDTQDYKQIMAQAPTSPNDDPIYKDLKESAAKKLQRAYRQKKH